MGSHCISLLPSWLVKRVSRPELTAPPPLPYHQGAALLFTMDCRVQCFLMQRRFKETVVIPVLYVSTYHLSLLQRVRIKCNARIFLFLLLSCDFIIHHFGSPRKWAVLELNETARLVSLECRILSHVNNNKIKLSLCLIKHYAMKACGSGCVDPHFLDLGASWRWVINFTPRPLYPRGKSPRYPLNRRLGGPHSRSGRFGEERILDPTGTRTPTPRSSSP
jgi:hypothetical protein